MRTRGLAATLGVLAAVAGCSTMAALVRDDHDAAASRRIAADGAIGFDAPRPPEPGASDAARDAPEAPKDAPEAPLVASPALRVFPRQGSPADDTRPALGPGLLLDGGFSGGVTRTWMHAASTGGSALRGDVVVLSPNVGDASSGWLAAAPFSSVQTVVLEDGATDADYRIAADLVRRAEVVWFTGADQAKYVRWKGSPLMAAVQAVFNRGGVIGGTSAGMIILGSSVNDAFNTLSENITTPVAVANPYDPRIHFTQNVLVFPDLQRTITDPHFVARDRMGRLSAFMARQVKDGYASPDILGIAVDDGAALAIGKDGRGRRLADSSAPAVFVVRGGAPTQATPGLPLVYRGLRAVKLASADHAYDFRRRCGRGLVRTFDVDGAQSPPYPADVYADGTLADECL